MGAQDKLCNCPDPDVIFEWFADQGIAYLMCCHARKHVTRDASGTVTLVR
ncbi:hypothetical protein [Amycolatopsis thermoflava]|nr:hypothetical protein [Amycolatopsis thermoflava]